MLTVAMLKRRKLRAGDIGRERFWSYGAFGWILCKADKLRAMREGK
jgi:hypothetical protein